MYGDFLETMTSNVSEHQLFQLLDGYESVCHDNVGLLKKINKNTVPGHQRWVAFYGMSIHYRGHDCSQLAHRFS